MVVIMAGYDQWYDTFADSFDQVVAHRHGPRVQSASSGSAYPEGVDYLLPDGTPGNESLVNINQIMRDMVASGAYPRRRDRRLVPLRDGAGRLVQQGRHPPEPDRGDRRG